MTDAQLLVLLSRVRDDLEGALERTRERLPPELSKRDKDFLGRERVRFPALSPLEDVLERLSLDIDTLKQEERS